MEYKQLLLARWKLDIRKNKQGGPRRRRRRNANKTQLQWIQVGDVAQRDIPKRGSSVCDLVPLF